MTLPRKRKNLSRKEKRGERRLQIATNGFLEARRTADVKYQSGLRAPGKIDHN